MGRATNFVCVPAHDWAAVFGIMQVLPTSAPKAGNTHSESLRYHTGQHRSPPMGGDGFGERSWSKGALAIRFPYDMLLS